MKLILFIIVFTCILAIRFFAFIMKSAFDTAQIIHEKPRNTISKIYGKKDDPLLVDIINIAQKSECFNIEKNTYEEFLFALEIYILLVSYIGFFVCKKKEHLSNLINIYANNIIDYINRNVDNIKFLSEKTHYAKHYLLDKQYSSKEVVQNITFRCETYHKYMKDYYDEMSVQEAEYLFHLNLAFMLRDFLYGNLQNDKLCQENFYKKIIANEINDKNLYEIVLSIEFIAKSIIIDITQQYQ